MKYELSNEVTETLIEEGILDDDIRELFELILEG